MLNPYFQNKISLNEPKTRQNTFLYLFLQNLILKHQNHGKNNKKRP